MVRVSGLLVFVAVAVVAVVGVAVLMVGSQHASSPLHAHQCSNLLDAQKRASQAAEARLHTAVSAALCHTDPNSRRCSWQKPKLKLHGCVYCPLTFVYCPQNFPLDWWPTTGARQATQRDR